jgi:hypothetical protein
VLLVATRDNKCALWTVAVSQTLLDSIGSRYKPTAGVVCTFTPRYALPRFNR